MCIRDRITGESWWTSVSSYNRNSTALSVQNYLQEGTEAAWRQSSHDVVWWCTAVIRHSALYEHLLLLSCWTGLWSHGNLRRWNCSRRYCMHCTCCVIVTKWLADDISFFWSSVVGAQIWEYLVCICHPIRASDVPKQWETFKLDSYVLSYMATCLHWFVCEIAEDKQ